MIEISECTKCHRMFRDGPDTAGVCPCGYANTADDFDHEDQLRRIQG